MIDEKQLIEDFKNTFSDSVLNQTFGFGKYTFLEAIEEMINRQPQIVTDTNVGSKWIQCSERLPEEYQTVITTHEDGSVIVHGYMKKHGFIYNWETDEEKRTKQGGVIAWMPLPEPYKGE